MLRLPAPSARHPPTLPGLLPRLSRPAGPHCPQHLLEVAYLSTVARGSSTACILCLENERLHASNLGDSGARGWGGGSGRWVRQSGGSREVGVGVGSHPQHHPAPHGSTALPRCCGGGHAGSRRRGRGLCTHAHAVP